MVDKLGYNGEKEVFNEKDVVADVVSHRVKTRD